MIQDYSTVDFMAMGCRKGTTRSCTAQAFLTVRLTDRWLSPCVWRPVAGGAKGSQDV